MGQYGKLFFFYHIAPKMSPLGVIILFSVINLANDHLGFLLITAPSNLPYMYNTIILPRNHRNSFVLKNSSHNYEEIHLSLVTHPPQKPIGQVSGDEFSTRAISRQSYQLCPTPNTLRYAHTPNNIRCYTTHPRESRP